MKLYDNIEIQSIATEFIGKPQFVITDGWRTDYIEVNYESKKWHRISDYFFLNDLDFLNIDALIFPDGSNM